MTGTTPICQSCGRVVIGAAFYGNAGEPYHVECTQPPSAPLAYRSGFRDALSTSEKDKALVSGRIDGLRMAIDALRKGGSLAQIESRIEIIISEQSNLG